jgi:AraC-like DNA-binding protein
VFFSPAFVSQVVSELNSTDERLLDFCPHKTEGFNLIERNYQHRGVVSEILLQAKRKPFSDMSTLEKDEFYHMLLSAMFFQNQESWREANSLLFKKSATRTEIYRRVLYAKDYIDANYTQNLTLKEISQAAMLSENHLLRNFNQIFNSSPFQYITRLKIAEAQLQIMETGKSISEIALSLGYASLSNFSYYFKGIVGLSPMDLRKKVTHRK